MTLVVDNNVTARTEKDCKDCNITIKSGEKFVRIGYYPFDIPLHTKCAKKLRERLGKI